jgi:hypothetical protein
MCEAFATKLSGLVVDEDELISNLEVPESEINHLFDLTKFPDDDVFSFMSGEQETQYSMLHLAAIAGFEKVAKHLLERAADVNLPNLEGQTPLYCAAKYLRLNVVELLLSNGAAAFFPDEEFELLNSKVRDLLTGKALVSGPRASQLEESTQFKSK